MIEKTRLHDADVAVNPMSMASHWSHIRHFNSYSPSADSFVVPLFQGSRRSYRANRMRINELKIAPGFFDTKQPPVVVMLNQRSLLSRTFEGDTATAKVAVLILSLVRHKFHEDSRGVQVVS